MKETTVYLVALVVIIGLMTSCASTPDPIFSCQSMCSTGAVDTFRTGLTECSCRRPAENITKASR